MIPTLIYSFVALFMLGIAAYVWHDNKRYNEERRIRRIELDEEDRRWEAQQRLNVERAARTPLSKRIKGVSFDNSFGQTVDLIDE